MEKPKLTNNKGISLSMAVWMATDKYDHNDNPSHISATSLIKPIRQLVLANRLPPSTEPGDVYDNLASAMGTAFHDAVEDSWKNHRSEALKDLGYPEAVIKKIVVNPPLKFVKENPTCIPVYLEQRVNKKIGKFTISGKFDFVGEGIVEDIKSTSTYSFMKDDPEEYYGKTRAVLAKKGASDFVWKVRG